MKKYPQNLLFLDYDGCMTSLADFTYFNPEPTQYHTSQHILQLILKFCSEHNVKVVITSNWRKFDEDGSWKNSIGTFSNPLPTFKKELGDSLFDVLSPERHTTKSVALKKWFDQNPDFSGGYAIFDDDKNEGYQTMSSYGISTHFVKIDPILGVTKNDLETAKKLFERKNT